MTGLVAVASRSFSRHPILRAELVKKHADVRFNDGGQSLSGESLVAFLQDAPLAITALETISDSILARLPALRVLSKFGVGVDMIDLDALTRRGIRLGWTGGTNKRSVAELVLSMAIGLLRHVPAANRAVLGGTWKQVQGRELSHCIVGVIGYGHVGREVSVMLRKLGAHVVAHDIRPDPAFCAANDIEPIGLDELLSRSHVVSLHVPLDATTRYLLSSEKLRLMRPDAILINTARGGIVDERALKTMLLSGRLAGAGLDVFAEEPPTDHELLALPNVLATPHLGGSSEEAVLAMGRAAIAGLEHNRVPGPGWPLPLSPDSNALSGSR